MLGFVALGSNLGNRLAHVQAGVRGLAAAGVRIEAVSSVWETEPVDTEAREWFLNAAVRIGTDLPPEGLLDVLLMIELARGRVRDAVNAPRTLDLDLLMLGSLRVDTPRLVLPHPRLWTRRFVLAPLAEVGPELVHPETGRGVAEVLAALSAPGRVERVARLAMPRVPPVYSGLS